ncbi:MAG: hypothetical protein V7L21_15370 [Nostoc sp.]|uniref:hypothetical protein n=1 Tax=Nostoc sp. TaxID=1180 RepID=UPI002FFA673A
MRLGIGEEILSRFGWSPNLQFNKRSHFFKKMRSLLHHFKSKLLGVDNQKSPQNKHQVSANLTQANDCLHQIDCRIVRQSPVTYWQVNAL